MKKVVALLLSLAFILSLAGCKKEKTTVQDESPVTVLISSSGNSEAYFLALQSLVKKELGIDIEFVTRVSGDSTNMTRLLLEHNAVPADIVFTASRTDDALLAGSCVDLLSRSSVTSGFTVSALSDCTTADGKVYQLPISSKLIGITYNETLLKELGCEVPKTFADMLALKQKCDEEGVRFAVTDGAATGHGFNWLFHLMGAQWLSTLEGSDWFEGYMKGEKTIDAFSEQCAYFKKWTEAGLWGDFLPSSWTGSGEFGRTRTLFWYGLTNSADGYDGPEYDLNGNETGVTLHDTFRTIPWISEDGSNNVYTKYDNCWVLVNKALEAPEKADKLEKVIKIIELLISPNAIALVNELASDTYVCVNSYKLTDDRLYSAFREEVKKGFLQPWYYNSFDTDSIVFTGEKVNNYLAGNGSFEEIFTTLDSCTQNRLASRKEVLTSFPEGLGFEDTARLTALATAAAVDKTLEQNDLELRVDVTIIPYSPDGNGLPAWRNVSVSNSFVFAGEFDASIANALIPIDAINPVAIAMTGAEIKALTEKGFDPSDRYIDAATGKSTFDAEHYGPYPYIVITKGGAELKDEQTYTVALSERYITSAQFTAFKEAGNVLELKDTVTINRGVTLFVNGRSEIRPADLVF